MMVPGGTMCELQMGGQWGEEDMKKEGMARNRGLFTQQTGVPSPSSYPFTHPPTVGDTDPRGAVNSSGMESQRAEPTPVTA